MCGMGGGGACPTTARNLRYHRGYLQEMCLFFHATDTSFVVIVKQSQNDFFEQLNIITHYTDLCVGFVDFLQEYGKKKPSEFYDAFFCCVGRELDLLSLCKF